MNAQTLVDRRNSDSVPPSSIRGVIFDRDGVLTRFDMSLALELFRGIEVRASSMAHLATPDARLNEAFTRWEAWYRASEPARDEAAEHRVLAGFMERLCDDWCLDPESRAHLLEFDYLRMIRPHEDAKRALVAARNQGLRIGVLSNFPMASLGASLHAAGFDGLFDAAAAAPVIGAAKPDPRAYQYMLDALGVSPDECLMIDDEAQCVEGARAIGIHAWLLERAESGGFPTAAGTLSDLDSFIPFIERGLLPRECHHE